MNYRIRIKLLHSDVRIPTRGSRDAVGWDLYAPKDHVVPPHTARKLPLGFALQFPAGLYGMILPRSGLMSDGFTVFSAPIDPDYRGEVGVVLANINHERWWDVKAGDRVAQLILLPLYGSAWAPVSELPPTKRGDGGFGSSGR